MLFRSDLAMAVVYTTSSEPFRVTAPLRAVLGDRALYVPVEVPTFYYPGMEIELDLFVVAGGPGPRRLDAGTGWEARTVAAGDLRFVSAIVEPGADIAGMRASLNLDAALVEHWSLSDPRGLPAHAILGPSGLAWAVIVEGATSLSLSPSTAAITLRKAPGWLSLTGLAPEAYGLVAQTEAIMEALASVLHDNGANFSDVVKSTTHYVGDPTPEDLHANMAVRNRRYTSPGPASTGIRVRALAAPGALTAISLLLEGP